MKKISFTFLIAILFLSFNSQAQQAWTQKKGSGYFQVGSSFYKYLTVYGADAETVNIARSITENTLSLYGEYGLSSKLTATVSVPLHFISSDELNAEWEGFLPEEGKLTALGNINLALTYQWYKNDGKVLAAKIAASLNTASFDEMTGLKSGYQAIGITPIILAGIGKDNFFASAEVGLNYLSNDYLPRFLFNAQIGKPFGKSKRLIGIFGITSSTSLGEATIEENLKINGNSSYTWLYQNEQTYYAINLKLGYKFSKKWSIWLSSGGGTAKNLGRGAVYTIALGYNL